MVNDPDTTIILTLAGSTIAGRCKQVYIDMVRNHMVDVVVATGAALIYGTLDMPRYGDPTAPVHQHVMPAYIQETPTEIGVPNVVTAVLASYRGYDTLGEVTVIFTAGVGVLILLVARSRKNEKENRSE